MSNVQMTAMANSPLAGGENAVLSQRPYIATSGRHAGHPVVAYATGQLDQHGMPQYGERRITANATLRKDEWINLDQQIIEAARERLVIVDDLQSAGLTYNVGGLGTITTEWETASEMTDAEITLDGESTTNKDRQEFGLDGVPIPVIGKEFKIAQRMLLASRTRGSSLDVTQGVEAARAVARVSERLIFNGAPNFGNVDGRGIPGLTTYANRATYTISDWTDTANVTPENIFTEILEMVKELEVNQRHFGPFTLYIPGEYAFRFREDFKEFGTKTLMERVTDEPVISRVRVSDTLAAGNVVMVQMERSVIDLAVASDITTVQWSSGSGWTENFQTYAAWSPRIKSDHAGRTGICHGSTA